MSLQPTNILKLPSLFAMFCLSYVPLFLLLGLKIVLQLEVEYTDNHLWDNLKIGLQAYWFVLVLVALILFAFYGTYETFHNINKAESNAFPVKVLDIELKNDQALSYLITYVLPLLASGNIGAFEYIAFCVLFLIYFKLYATSNLILINPILNMRYGLYEMEFEFKNSNARKGKGLIISKNNLISIGEDAKVIQISHRLYFLF